MPRNLHGGCHAKKGSNKMMQQHSRVQTPFPNETVHLGVVTKVCGDGRYTVDTIVPKGPTFEVETLMGILPGRLRRIARSIKQQSWVLVQPWDFVSEKTKADVVHLYADSEIQILRHAGYMRFDGLAPTIPEKGGDDDEGAVDISAI